MRGLLKLIILFAFGITIYTVYTNWAAGNPWTKDALQRQLGITLGVVKVQGKVISQGASAEGGKVLGEMTRRMTTEPIWTAITGSIVDEGKAIPYNICKPVVTNYEAKK